MNLKFWALLLLSATLAMACSGESNDAAATADGGGGGAGAKDASAAADSSDKPDATGDAAVSQDGSPAADAAVPDASPPPPEPDYYVTPTGKASNDGKTEQTAWSLDHAFATAKAGDAVYVKAGLYADFTITQNGNGTSENPIQFIGYTSTPGDINPHAQTSYSLGTQTIQVLASFAHGDKVDASKMPLLRENRSGSVGSGTALVINGDYVVLNNLQFQYYEAGMRVSGDHCQLTNLIFTEQGDFASDAYSGKGVYNYGNDNHYKNIYVENSGAQNFSIRGNGGTYDAISVVSDNTTNPTDYYFLFQEGHDNTATNIYVHRVGQLAHDGHGIVYKTPSPCYNNNVTGFIIDNTNLEIQFPGVHDNTVKNGYVFRPLSEASITGAGARLANGAYDCTIDNVFFENCLVRFCDWPDGLAGDAADSADGFVFNRITVINAQSAVAFNYFKQGYFSSSADNNTFYNSTFYGASWHYELSRANSNTKFVNCIFSDIPKYSFSTGGSPGYPADVSYSSVNFFNYAPAVPSGTNVTTADPKFVDPKNYDFSLGTGSTLKGKGIATPFLPAGNDIGSYQ